MRKCKSTQPDTMNSDHLLAVICIKVLGSSEYALTHGEALISKNLWLPVRKKNLTGHTFQNPCIFVFTVIHREFANVNFGTMQGPASVHLKKIVVRNYLGSKRFSRY